MKNADLQYFERTLLLVDRVSKLEQEVRVLRETCGKPRRRSLSWVELALIAGLIAIGIVVAASSFGSNLDGLFTRISVQLDAVE